MEHWYLYIRYVGLSSTGITFRSGSAPSLNSSSFQKSGQYGGFGSSRVDETFKDSFKVRDQSNKDRFEPGKYKPRKEVTSGSSSKKGSSLYARFDLCTCSTSYLHCRVVC